MQLHIQPMTQSAALALASWRYPEPYALYNLDSPPCAADLAYFLDPAVAYHELMDQTGTMVGFCTFGKDGQVPGGDYAADALDLGMGIRPDLTGLGLGATFACAVIDFAAQHYAPSQLRVTIAAFNQRAQRVWRGLGFEPVMNFGRVADGMPFIIFTRSAQR